MHCGGEAWIKHMYDSIFCRFGVETTYVKDAEIEQFKNAGSLNIATGNRPVCENLKHIMMAVRWGGHESLILPGVPVLPTRILMP
jgi:hypothetical protein